MLGDDALWFRDSSRKLYRVNTSLLDVIMFVEVQLFARKAGVIGSDR
jgi:hypothetical protein